MKPIQSGRLLRIAFALEGLLFLFVQLWSALHLNSPAGLGIIFLQAFVIGIGAWQLHNSNMERLRRLCCTPQSKSEPTTFRPFVGVSLFVLALLSWTALLSFTRQVYLVYTQASGTTRLILNFAFLLTALEFQIFFSLPILLRRNFAPQRSSNNWLKSLRLPLAAAVLLALIVLFTSVGINPLRMNIIDLGVPLLESQVLYGAGLLLLMIWLENGYRLHFFFNPEQKKARLVIFFLLWMLAFLAWNAQEIPINNNFVIGNVPPNHGIFPYSDARDYDEDAILMTLGGSQGVVFRRPLYVFILSLIHGAAGFEYASVIQWQILLMALIPAVLYLVGRELHSNGTGILMGLFAILREVNSIQAANLTSVSNSKLLLTDVPTLLMVSFIALVLIRWVKYQRSTPLDSILLGGCLGAGILLRSQVGFLVPFVLILCIVVFWKKPGQIFSKAGWVLLGILIVVSPILIRNYQINGVFGFDEPSYVALNLRRFDPAGTSFKPALSQSGFALYLDLIRFIVGHPGAVAAFISDHFMRNVLSTFFILPARLEQIRNWKDFFYISSPFWTEVNSQNGILNWAVILLNLLLCAAGVSALREKKRWLALSLLGIFTFYNLSNSIARLSGWRFVLPVDWIGYTLWIIGLTEILNRLSRKAFSALPASQPAATVKKTNSSWENLPVYTLLGLTLLLGWGLVIREQFSVYRPPSSERVQICSAVQQALPETVSDEKFLAYCLDETTFLQQGSGFYPEYFEKNSGYSDASEKSDLEARKDFARFIFTMIGKGQSVVYVRSETPAPEFPDGSRALAIEKKTSAGIQAEAVFFGNAYESVFLSDALLADLTNDIR